MPTSTGQLSVGVIRMMRMLHATRLRAPRVDPAVEPTHHALLVALSDKPGRVGDLAERTMSDASTVSRQVSHLSSLGLLTKIPDPEDGRAQLVALSEEGRSLLDDLVQQREAWFAELLADWSEEDLQAFTGYVERFCDTVGADLRSRD